MALRPDSEHGVSDAVEILVFLVWQLPHWLLFGCKNSQTHPEEAGRPVCEGTVWSLSVAAEVVVDGRTFFSRSPPLGTRSQAVKLARVNFSLVLLRAFSADWPPRWRRGRGHDDTRTGPYPDPLANRAGGSHPDKRDQNSPPASPPLAPLLHPPHARKEDGPRRHRLSRTTNRRALEARRSPRRKRSAQSVGSAEPATQQSKSLLTPWQAAPRPQTWADQVVIVGTQRLALLPTPRQLVLVPVRLAWRSAPWWLPGALVPCLGSRIYPRSLLWEPPSRLHV